MKEMNHVKRYTCLITTSVMILLLAGSCARKATFRPSTQVPAAEGKVKVKRDKNRNYTIDVDVFNLTEPDRLQPPRNTYVVWMVGEDGTINNLGQIRSSSGLFSKTRKGSLETSSPSKPVKIFITSEDLANIEIPVSPPVLSTSNF